MSTPNEVRIWEKYRQTKSPFNEAFFRRLEGQWPQATFEFEGNLADLAYFRDIEQYTPDLYLPQLLSTPSGRDDILYQFLHSWASDESSHGRLWDEYLKHAGVQVEPYRTPLISVGTVFRWRLAGSAERVISPLWKALHMTWGAVNELTTELGYQLLRQLTQCPVLHALLTAVGQDESRHAGLYLGIAREKLGRSRAAQIFIRFAIEHFWGPVGSGEEREAARRIMNGLLQGAPKDVFESKVAIHIKKLPGLANLQLSKKFEASLGLPN